MESNPIEYKLIIESPQGQVTVDLGNEPGWLEHHRQLLKTASRISLLPRHSGLPFVCVALGGTRRWIYFSRVCGSLNVPNPKQIRLYAVGWQDTVGGKNVKSILWVYPDGSVECGDEPSFVELFLGGSE